LREALLSAVRITALEAGDKTGGTSYEMIHQMGRALRNGGAEPRGMMSDIASGLKLPAQSGDSHRTQKRFAQGSRLNERVSALLCEKNHETFPTEKSRTPVPS
jgi:hypothetical protein